MIKRRLHCFEGNLPKSLVNCTFLEVLDVGSNRINDTFPSWLGSIPMLQVLILRHNNFYGKITTPFRGSVCNDFHRLRIIDLSYNYLTGNLPSGYFQSWDAMAISTENLSNSSNSLFFMYYVENYQIWPYDEIYNYVVTITNKGSEIFYPKILTVLRVIDFSSNKFTGRIPKDIGNVRGLQTLNLSNNNLVGPIPSSLANITGLESLDLSENILSGSIPRELTVLNFLEVFNVSHNRLVGPIPERLCEYTGQLFCSSCHTNETAVLPARVLHNWDFTPYPVSQMAKSFLDSIVDKPMLCVSAANPLLFSRVPALLHVVGIRRKIGAMLPYIHCTFRRSIYRRLGYRKYLLESNDFFALRDLDDLSKGAFAALPAILEAVSKKIQEHITELCLECCDLGVSCGARQVCDNPSSLIFPFQEEEIQRCESCKSVFHKHCLNKLQECPCGAVLKLLANDGSASGFSSSLVKKSDPKSGLLSRMFSISRQEKGLKDNDNVILMGSLPNTSL